MVEVTALRCSNPECSGKPYLKVRTEGGLLCPECGQGGPVESAIRPYAQRTGQWIVGGAALSAVGWTGFEGDLGCAIASVGGAMLLYAIARIVRQAILLKTLSNK